jgi:2-amino-4-hydroxy-6-hydroxymethyldihydropteridine diphosphokinase
LKNQVQFVFRNQLEWKLTGQNKTTNRIALISLGSNINPEANITAALEFLSEELAFLKASSIWQTPAVGSAGADYLNAAVLVETSLPLDILQSSVLAPIENKLGRVRQEDKFADRTIDLDVIVYGGKVLDPDLWIQAHVAVPASEVIPNWINPDTGESLLSTADRLKAAVDLNKRSDVS